MSKMRDGTRLASRAFAYSWLWSVGGVSLICYTVWKCSGAKDVSYVYILDQLTDFSPANQISGKGLRKMSFSFTFPNEKKIFEYGPRYEITVYMFIQYMYISAGLLVSDNLW